MAKSSDASGASNPPQTDAFFQTADQELAHPQGYSLGKGLTALKQKDYDTAIAHLEATCQGALDETTLLKAQMGLVMAYDKTGELKLAIALCKPLCDHSSEQVKTWANKTLTHLESRHSQSQATMMPLSEVRDQAPGQATRRSSTPENPSAAPATPAASNETGFVPLSPAAAHLNQARASETGFVPLDQKGSQSRVRVPLSPISSGSTSELSPQSDPALADQTASHSTETEDSSISSRQQPPFSVQPADPTEPMDHRSADSGASEDPSPVNDSEPPTPSIEFKQAGRASKWNPIRQSTKSLDLWVAIVGTPVALVLMCLLLVNIPIALNNWVASWIGPIFLLGDVFDTYTGQPLWLIVPILLVLGISSPWSITTVLRMIHGAKVLPNADLQRYSPEAVRILKRFCNQHRYQAPTLLLINTPAPISFTYGFLARNARIVVSQGLLERLDDDEIAAIYAAEAAHIANKTVAVLSLAMVIQLIPYVIYAQVTHWGDRTRNFLVRFPAAILGAIFYGLYWILRLPPLWFARLRQEPSDRLAVNLTGNPNGLTRALLKISRGIAQDIQRQRKTSHLLESFDLLFPVGVNSALTAGSVYEFSALEPVLAWDFSNPYRQWLSVNNSHARLGDRLRTLYRYARDWHLDTELDFRSVPSRTESSTPSWINPLIIQGAPFWGILFGIGLGLLAWAIGFMLPLFGIEAADWLWGNQPVLLGCICIGCSIGILFRINPFFPNIRSQNTLVDPFLPDLITPYQTLPIDSQPVRLHGTLLGRSGLGNALEQDLILQTSSGLIKLHFLSPVGALGNLFPQAMRPHDVVKTSVTIKGWFRRGATPWIDVDVLQTGQGRNVRSGHPIWSTILAFVFTIFGLYLIMQ